MHGTLRRLCPALKEASFTQVAQMICEPEENTIGSGRLPHRLTCNPDTLLEKRFRFPRLAEVLGVNDTGIVQRIPKKDSLTSQDGIWLKERECNLRLNQVPRLY